MKRILPKDIAVRISNQGGKAVILTITDHGGETYAVILESHLADEIGRDILAGALALNGMLA